MKVLDCTLRDGGYCNQWEFGFENIKKIVDGLCDSGIDIIECGFLTQKENYNSDITKYNTMEEISHVLPANRHDVKFVCMINYGEYDVLRLPECDGCSVDGIRLAFHKKDAADAMKMGEQIIKRGYTLFLQPMVSLNYSDEEFISLIRRSNVLNPYAFYIVDSFGVMKQKDLIRLFYLVEHNLDDNIAIGFHSHNNMQLAYSNAQALLGADSDHELIIDASVFGMGRGAGNLNTELLVEYLNDNYKQRYSLKPLLRIIDEILNRFYQQNYWGYSLPNYLSAKHNVHPSYAAYLDSRKTLTIDEMDDIFAMMDQETKVSYDKEYIEQLYLSYCGSGEIQNVHLAELTEKIRGREILVIAPGQSCFTEREKIIKMAEQGVLTISVNFNYSEVETDYIFISNFRRYRELPKDKLNRCIITSNIKADDVYFKADYKRLLNSDENVMDNAGLMLIQFLTDLECKKIFLAGLDGYDYDISRNYAVKNMRTVMTREWIENTNAGITNVLKQLEEKVEIEFVTTPRFVDL